MDPVKREGHTVLLPTNQIAAVRDPPAKQRTGHKARLQPLVAAASVKSKHYSTTFLFFPPEFSTKLEKDICGDTSGYYQKLLVILLQVKRRRAAGQTFLMIRASGDAITKS